MHAALAPSVWHFSALINARCMCEGYCNHPVCLCVCLSVTAPALTYDVCATNLAYQCILRCTQKVLN